MANHYTISAMESLFFNAGVILITAFGTFLFREKNVMLPIIGAYLAYFAFITICILRIRRDYSLTFHFNFNDFQKTIRSSAILISGTLLAYVSPLIIMWHATFSEEGVVSSLGYASRLLLFAVGTIVNSMMTVFLPSASLSVADGSLVKLTRQTEKLLSICFIVSSTAVIAILLGGEYAIQLLFQRGAFDDRSKHLVFEALIGYLPWVLFFPLSAIAVRVLYANRDYQMIFMISLICLIIPLTAAPFFGRKWEVFGFALTASFHMSCYAILLIGVLLSKYIKIDFVKTAKACLPSVTASSLAGIFYWGIITTSPTTLPTTSPVSFTLLVLVLAGIALWGINSIVPLSTIFETQLSPNNKRKK